MSGHASFSTIGGNPPPPMMPDPASEASSMRSVDGAKDIGSSGEAPPAPPASDDPAGAEGNARSMAQRLDALLLQAAKLTTRPVEAEELQNAMKGIPQNVKDFVQNAAQVAREKMSALSQFTGLEIAKSFVLGADGKLGWKADDPVATAIREAVEAQGELSLALHQLLNLPELDNDGFDAVMDLAFKCDRRQSEIYTLATQLAAALLDSPDDPEVANILDKRFESLLPRQAVAMHGTAAAIETLKDDLKGLANRLDDFAARPNASLTSAELAAYSGEMLTAANALEGIAKNGISQSEERHERVLLDKDLLAAAEKLASDAREKLQDTRKGIGLAMVEHFIDTVIGLPGDMPALSEANLASVRRRMPNLFAAAQLRHQMRVAAHTYASKPDDTNLRELYRLCGLYMQIDAKRAAEEAESYCNNLRARNPNSEEVPDGKKLSASFARARAMHTQMAHLVQMVKIVNEKLAPEQFLSTTSARALVEGRLDFSTLVEARVHGMSDADVDPNLDDSLMQSQKQLGSGANSTVFLVKYKDDSEWVFKAEAPGRQGIAGLALSKDYASEEQVAHLNLATQDAAKALGAEDVSTSCSVGAHEGQYGLFMEKAPGVEAKEFKSGGEVPPGSLTSAQVKALPPADYAKVVGGIMRGINRLEWLDLVTGQGDRHEHNYMIDVRADLTVSVKGIDNDMCFPAYRPGLRTYVLRGRDADAFRRAVTLAVDAYPMELHKAVWERMMRDTGVHVGQDWSVTLDTMKFQAGELHYSTRMAVGVHGSSLPEYIDEQFYQRLMALKDGQARADYFAALAKRLPPEAVAAAQSRLDEAISFAVVLKRNGRVVSEADFAKQEVQRDLVRRELDMPNPVQPVQDYMLSDDTQVVKAAKYQVHTTFMRDVFDAIRKDGWFEDEQKP